MNTLNWKSIGLNYALPIVLFLAIAYAYFSPQLEGKVLKAHDTEVYLASAKEINDFRRETGEEALWTNSMFGGMPAYHISTKYTGNKVSIIGKMLLLGSRPASYLFLWFISFFVLMLALGVKPWLSFVGALAYGFTSNFFVLTGAGHMTKILTLGYSALVFAGLIWAFKGKKWLGASVLGIALSLMLNSGHPQMTYYTGLGVLIFGMVYLIFAIKEKTVLNFFTIVGILLVSVVLALGTNYGRTVADSRYAKYTTRGKTELTVPTGQETNRTGGLDKNYIWDWSYGKGETFTIMIPNFRGGASKSIGKDSESYKILRKNGVKEPQRAIQSLYAYWGPQQITSGPSYFGAIICFLFILGLFLVKGRDKWWLLALTVFSILLSWGKNLPWFAGFFIDYFPLFNKFRDMSMLLVIAHFTMPVLAILALKEVFQEKWDKAHLTKALYWSFGLTGGLSLVFAIMPSLSGSFTSENAMIATRLEGTLPAWLMETLILDRQDLLKTDAFRSFFLILIAAGLLWAFVNNKIKQPLVIGAFALLFLVDMWPIAKRYLNNDNFQSKSKSVKVVEASKADKQILLDKDLSYRVLNLTVSPFNDATTSYFHKSIGGYHGAKLQRYQELIEAHISPEMQAMSSNFKGATSAQDIFTGLTALNMLNTRYVIVNPNSSPVANPLALGNAWGIQQVRIVQNADEEIAGVKNIDPAKQAVVDKKFESALSGFTNDTISNAVVKLISYAPNHLKYTYNSDKKEAVIFSEIYYEDGWNAYIDGEKTDYFRANYVLRGLVVPEGKHDIEFVFEPSSFYTGNTISLASSILLILAFVGVLILEGKKGVCNK